ncbi:MAG: response regulator transcription factor [Bacilli bacterium]|nr:response regulator transcription factor [Bacilli bacterium]
MTHVTIIDDKLEDRIKLELCLREFFERNHKPYVIQSFENGLDFLDKYKCNEHIIFIDIDLPFLDGMSLAKKIRERNNKVVIIFISSLAHFAIRGYEVSALDFIIKPFEYTTLEHRLIRAMNAIDKTIESGLILKLATDGGNVVCDPYSIEYIEKDKNYLIFHTTKNIYKVRGTLHQYEKLLPKDLFSCCIKGVLVNISYIKKTTNNSVVLKSTTLPLSRLRKKDFLDDLYSFFGTRRSVE